MLMNRTHLNSIVARGRKATGQTCAELFSERFGVAAVLCPGSLPTYLPGGELMRKGANAASDLRNADRRVNLI